MGRNRKGQAFIPHKLLASEEGGKEKIVGQTFFREKRPSFVTSAHFFPWLGNSGEKKWLLRSWKLSSFFLCVSVANEFFSPSKDWKEASKKANPHFFIANVSGFPTWAHIPTKPRETYPKNGTCLLWGSGRDFSAVEVALFLLLRSFSLEVGNFINFFHPQISHFPYTARQIHSFRSWQTFLILKTLWMTWPRVFSRLVFPRTRWSVSHFGAKIYFFVFHFSFFCVSGLVKMVYSDPESFRNHVPGEWFL